MTTTRMLGQGALFGAEQTPTPSHPTGPDPADAATNDVELVASVIRLATDPGYVLVGPAERVMRRVAGDNHAVEPVPRYEQDTVRQLLDSRHLRPGGAHHVTAGTHDGPAAAVLVPRTTRDMANRWAALHRLPASPAGPTDAPARQRSGPVHVDIVAAGKGLVTCGAGDFSGTVIRNRGREFGGGTYYVETEHGDVIGTASSYRRAAHKLARHHDFTPTDVIVETEKEYW